MQQAKEYAEITDFDTLAESANQPDADPFDLLCLSLIMRTRGRGGNGHGV
jgi:hypothetical protein